MGAIGQPRQLSTVALPVLIPLKNMLYQVNRLLANADGEYHRAFGSPMEKRNFPALRNPAGSPFLLKMSLTLVSSS
jgi:hypothetical protein